MCINIHIHVSLFFEFVLRRYSVHARKGVMCRDGL